MRDSRSRRSNMAFLIGAAAVGCLSAAAIPDEDTIVWPKPRVHTMYPVVGRIEAHSFEIVVTESTNDSETLQAAIGRYQTICFQRPPIKLSWVGRCITPPCPPPPAPPTAQLEALLVQVASGDETLSLYTNENYTLFVEFPNATLKAETVYGAMRGLETFSQLLQADYTIRKQHIVDYPRFPFRSVMIDTGRHFLAPELIKANLDAMAMNKLNVLHWHLVDLPSFPFKSDIFPDLALGAFDIDHVYTTKDIRGIVAYAQQRGIRVIPEFDTPSHTYPSWDLKGVLANNSQLLTRCTVEQSLGGYGPLRVDKPETYVFLQKLFTEIGTLFPDAVFNIGGDEAHCSCWQSNTEVAAFMKSQNLNCTGLVAYYSKKLFDMVNRTLQKSPMMWRPGIGDLVGPTDTPADALYNIYGGAGADQNLYNVSATATTAQGFQVVRSAGYYLDHLCPLDPDGKHHGTYWGTFSGWEYYAPEMDPQYGVNASLGGRPELVIGGNALMWGEHVDGTNLINRIWPRTSVLAERFWSDEMLNDTKAAFPRLHEFRCRMVARGIAAEPIGSIAYGETGPYHTAFCTHDSDVVHYSPPLARDYTRWADLNLSLSQPRSRLVAAAVGDVMIFAGGLPPPGVIGAGEPSDVVDIFDFSHQPPLHTVTKLSAPRVFDGGQNMAAVLGNKIYIGGGAGVNSSCNPNTTKCATVQSAVVDVFDAPSKQFDTPLPPLSKGRSFLATVAVPTAGVVLFGGGELVEDEAHPKAGRDSDVVDVWSVAQQKWLTPLLLSQPRKKLSAVSASNGLVYFLGGFTSDVNQSNCGDVRRPGMGCYRREIDIFNISSGKAFANTSSTAVDVKHATSKLSQGRMRLASAAVGGCIVVAGGEINVSHNDATGIVDIYCGADGESEGEWQVAELSYRRYESAAVTLGSKAYFGGGNPGVRGDKNAAGRVDVFDVSTYAWSTAELPTPRDRLAAAAVTSQSMVCFGGGGGGIAQGQAVECLRASS
jgi:hexosaminidase